jgi:WXG100 family type VII secretion target
MSSGIRVTPEQLQQVSGQLNAGAAQIEATLRQLSAYVQRLGSVWAGVDQARFLALFGQWQRDGQGLHEALTGIARLMQQAGTNYETTEQANASSFSRM